MHRLTETHKLTIIALAGLFCAARTVATDAPQATPQASPVVYAADTSERPSWARDAAGVTRMHNGLPRGVKATTAPQTLPRDPFQRTAVRALRGDWGPLKDWQREGYQCGLKQGATATHRAWMTCYYGTEANGRTTRYAGRCSDRTVAANRLLAGTWVWEERGNIRQVQDTGAHSNDSIARRRGAELWLDFWARSPKCAPFDTHTGMVAIILPKGAK